MSNCATELPDKLSDSDVDEIISDETERVEELQLTLKKFIIKCFIPLSENPSCLQATLASLVDQNPSQMVPQVSL